MAGGGGGAWKVAYADFVTAMMALFMVLWILTQDEEVKGQVQDYFRTRFKSITKQSVGIIPIENADLIEAKRANFKDPAMIPLEQVRRLNQDLVKAFVQNPTYIDMKTLNVEMTDEGLLIEFFNDPSRPLFGKGNSEITDYGKMLFGIAAWTLAKHDAADTTVIEVEGHTDSAFEPEDKKHADKWTVSSDRALQVREHLVSEGVKEHQFHKIAGYGDRQPSQKEGIRDNPKHEYHNRVSLMVRATRYEPGSPSSP